MSDEATYVVCALVSALDDPVDGSQIRWCGICAEEIWVSPSTFEAGVLDAGATPICEECVKGLPDAPAEVLPNVLAELRAHGIPEAAIDAALRHFNIRKGQK